MIKTVRSIRTSFEAGLAALGAVRDCRFFREMTRRRVGAALSALRKEQQRIDLLLKLELELDQLAQLVSNEVTPPATLDDGGVGSYCAGEFHSESEEDLRDLLVALGSARIEVTITSSDNNVHRFAYEGAVVNISVQRAIPSCGNYRNDCDRMQLEVTGRRSAMAGPNAPKPDAAAEG